MRDLVTVMRRDEEAALMREYEASLVRRGRRQLLVMGAAASVFVGVGAINWFWAPQSTVVAWASWLVSVACVAVIMVTILLYVTTRNRRAGTTYRQSVLDYGETAASDLAEATRERDRAREELNARLRAVRTCGFIVLLFVVGAMAVNYTSDNDTARGIGFIPVIGAMAATVWALRRAAEPRIRHDLAESRRRHLQEQFDANTSNTSESAWTSERGESEED